MATFRVNNLSGGKLAVPPPLDVILEAGASADVDAASADTSAIADLQDRNLISVVQLTTGLPSDGTDGASLGLAGSESKTTIGSAAAPVAMATAEVMTFTHGIGAAAAKVLIFDQATGGLVDPADVTITTNDGDELVLTNASGGAIDIVVEAAYDAGVDNAFSGALAASDPSVVVAP